MDINQETGYYPAPYSTPNIPLYQRNSMVAIVVLAAISVVFTLFTAVHLTHRIIREPKGSIQYLYFINSLIYADLFQAIGFFLDVCWVAKGAILAPHPLCQVQGAFINFGDVTSGLCVLSIALHMASIMVTNRELSKIIQYISFVGVWTFSFLLTIIGPAVHKRQYYTAAGNWCWVSPRYEKERLGFHYAWIFICQFGAVAIYIFLLYRLLHAKGANKSLNIPSPRITRLQKIMPMYPAIYVCLTLPLATARMIAFAGGHPSDTVLAIAGACLASCGAADAVVYGLTRDVFADSDWLPPSLWRRFKVYVRCNRRTSRDAVPAVESVRRRRGHRSLASRVLDEEAQEGGVGLDAVDTPVRPSTTRRKSWPLRSLQRGANPSSESTRPFGHVGSVGIAEERAMDGVSLERW